jgi:hypothetical protein
MTCGAGRADLRLLEVCGSWMVKPRTLKTGPRYLLQRLYPLSGTLDSKQGFSLTLSETTQSSARPWESWLRSSMNPLTLKACAGTPAAHLRHQLLEPLILLAQLTDFLRGGFPLRVAAHPPLASLHKVLQPLVVDRGVNPLAPEKFSDRDLSSIPSSRIRIFSSAGNLRRVTWRVRRISWRAASPARAGGLPSPPAGSSLRVHSF